MKYTLQLFFTALFAVFIIGLNAQSCPLNGYTVSFQGDVNNFAIEHPGCHIIDGDLRIQGVYLSDLNGLSQIDSVTGNVYISETGAALTSLHGLHNIRAMHQLRLTTGGLTDLTGLEGLRHLDNLVLYGNAMLQSFHGLENLQTLDLLSINFEEYQLNDISALSNITRLEGITIYSSNLTNLHGLENVVVFSDHIYLDSNPFLESIDLLSLDSIGSYLHISGNPLLTDLSGLSNLKYIGDDLTISYNEQLESCAVTGVCQALALPVPHIDISNNAPGCNSIQEVELACGVHPITILVSVLTDTGDNCAVDSTDYPASDIMVALTNDLFTAAHGTALNGTTQFSYAYLPFSLTLPQFPSAGWEICQDTFRFSPDTLSDDTLRVVFLLKPLSNCPELQTELSLPPFFRGCIRTSDITTDIQNTSGSVAENARLVVVVPDELVVTSCVPPPSVTIGDTLFFDLGDLAPFQKAEMKMKVHTDCALALEGRTLCLETFSFMDNACSPASQAASDVRLSSACIGDTLVRFTLKNVLDGFTQNPHEYIIIEDEIVLRGNMFNLGPLGSMDVDVPADGSTFRMEATRLEDGTLIANALEGCGGLTPGLITPFWLNTHPSDYDYDCREVRTAVDPNEKTAIPEGAGAHHSIPANRPITYNIEFQNTGTDTAARVLVRDILSPYLDVKTFRAGGASDAFTWEIRGLDTLEVLFQPIMLPDSNVNEAASHGWFSFTIDQKPNLAKGTRIENTASIIFDYNPPVITNTTFHTIGTRKRGRERSAPTAYSGAWQVIGNPVVTSAVFSSGTAIPGNKVFELINAAGITMRKEVFTGQRYEFARRDLSPGIYYFAITDRQGGAFSGTIVVQ